MLCCIWRITSIHCLQVLYRACNPKSSLERLPTGRNYQGWDAGQGTRNLTVTIGVFPRMLRSPKTTFQAFSALLYNLLSFRGVQYDFVTRS